MADSDPLLEILADAEQKIASLVSEALLRRDYAAVRRLSMVAQRIARAGDEHELTEGALVDSSTGVALPLADTVSRQDAENSGVQLPSDADDSNVPVHPGLKSFPRFHREGEQLVKIGYSKSDRRTYEHRCPRAVLDRVVAAIGEIVSNNTRFTTEQLLAPEAYRLQVPPSYQIYLSLAFLVRRGLVQRHGRAGYSLDQRGGGDLVGAVDDEWESLPRR